MVNKTQAIERFNLFADMLKHQVLDGDNNVLMLITGPTRQGKSSIAMALALRNDPHWDMSRIVFNTHDYVHIVNERPPVGSYIIYDDAGLGISSKRWWEQASVVFGMVAQSVAYRRYVTILTVPDMSWIEKTSRTLAKYIVEVPNDEQMKGWFWVRRGVSNKNLTRPNRLYPYVRLRKRVNGRLMPEVKLNLLYAPPLPGEIYAEYERIKDAVFTRTYQEYEKSLEEPEPRRKKHSYVYKGYNPKSKQNLKPFQKKNIVNDADRVPQAQPELQNAEQI
jgi:hypothetical protein